MKRKAKQAIVRVSLLALGTGFEIVSKRSKALQAELADWDEGRTFSLGVLPDGPSVALRHEGGRIRYLGQGDRDASLRIMFKNLDCALLPLTAQMGADTAYVQHRAILQGNIGQAMQISRAMQLVQTYLMPDIVMKRISKRAPRLTFRQWLLRVWVMATVGFGMAANLAK